MVAQRDILLAVALRDFNRVVDVRDLHGIVCDVSHCACAAATLEVAGECGGRTGPDFDAGAVRGVGHADVVDVDVLDVVYFAHVLAEGADRDAVGAVADEVLDDDVGAVGLEGDAVVAVVDVGVLDDDVGGAVGVPAVGVFGGVLALAAAEDVDVGEDYVGRVGDEVVPLWGVSQFEVFDAAAL